MAAPVVTTYTGEIPLRDGSQTNEEFSLNVGNVLSFIPPMIPEFNASLVWVNDTAEDVDENRGLAQTAATTATNAATTATTQAGIAVAAAASATLAPGTSATSTSTITPGYGSKSFTLVETGKTFLIDQFVTVSDPTSTAPNLRWFNGKITAFNSGTGAITVESGAFMGMTSGSSWVVTGSAPAFGQRFTNPTQNWVNLGNVSGTVNLDLRVAASFNCTIVGLTNFIFTTPDGYTSTDSISWALRLSQGATVYTIGYPAGTKFHQGAQAITGVNSTDEFVFKKLGTGDAFYRRAGNGFA